MNHTAPKGWICADLCSDVMSLQQGLRR